MFWTRRPAPQPHTDVARGPDQGRAALAATRRAAGGDRETLDAAARLLLDADTAETLVALSAETRLIIRLDDRARRPGWSVRAPASPEFGAGPDPFTDTAARRLTNGTAGPVSIALASMHRDGWVREDALARMASSRSPMWTPFLVLRSGDWVRQVRDRARTAVTETLATADAPHLGLALDMALSMRVRHRGGFSHAQAVAVAVTAHEGARTELLMSGPPYRRRFVFALGQGLGWWSPERMLRLARRDRDRLVRGGAAEAVCRDALWTGQDDRLLALAGSRYAQVRALALTGLARLGRHETVAGHLDDPGVLVRAIARDSARRAGLDAAGHYRAALSAARPATGAIAGLAETGTDRDAALLHGLFGHADARIRAAAVSGSRRLGVPPVALLLPLLRDPAAAVVREAATALLPLPRAVPESLIGELLTDPRVELRRAGHRLSRARGTEALLRAGLALIDDPDPGLAGRAAADVTRIARSPGAPADLADRARSGIDGRRPSPAHQNLRR
ncbi:MULTISPECIES: hypothetical protein [Catenuloplanes]|uniref:HEAT repeat domain-containing protein n=1 Tax=Catenuloplanes niger TaxID=587534 RepID=A0AAE4CPR3_9ACTN|nr:hypothetical protein [Catenuloplanes niger]MDR7320230.1 hypothetical protein [Catenuloplanes niger]